MSTTQKVIKYLAIALGIYLSINIVLGIIMGIVFVSDILNNNYSDKNENIKDTEVIADYEEEFKIDEIKELKIKLDISKLKIEKGDKLSVVGYNLYEECEFEVKEDTLVISEDIKRKIKIFEDGKTPNITLYVPENFEFNNVVINSGVGITNIEFLNTKKLDITFGTGNFNLNNINSNETKIKGGVGSLKIVNSNLGNLDFKAGVGDSKLECKINNGSKIESGVGNILLNLINEKDNYCYYIEKGLGNITINGKTMENGTFGDKEAGIYIKIIGGIGNIKINEKY